MAENFITIDGGTTNTRIRLTSEFETLDTVKLSVGARSGIDDRGIIENAVKDGISDILDRNGFAHSKITAVLASGMITSEFGLYSLPHIPAPAGIYELNRGMKRVELKNISKIPFYFIPGVKMMGGELENTDIMRGEETELIGIMRLTGENKGIYVLPGSHSKIIETDSNGRIISFHTMLTGEMIASIAQNTILKDAVALSVDDFDSEWLISGYEYCGINGINETLFKVRILKNVMKRNKTELYSFFLGAVLHDEVEKIIRMNGETVYIGGRIQIKRATAKLLKRFSDKYIKELPDEVADKAASAGMISIFNA